MRIFAISDLHTDFGANRLLLKQWSAKQYENDALLVAGDVADDLKEIEETLALLRSRFGQVFFTPGNHELWVWRDKCDSIEKLSRVLELCERLDVKTEPCRLAGVWVVPLFSWYSADFDPDEIVEDSKLEGWADFHFCRWPAGIVSPAEYLLKLNEPRIKDYDAPVISFSHFLPRRDLLPPTESLLFKGLPKVAGCHALEEQIRRMNSRTHVFGHSHINCDRLIDSVRYVQNALRYPSERRDSPFTPKVIWSS
jgi:predicted phosphodiesterase